MHHRMPTVKNWVVQFKRGDFSTCDAPRPGRPKRVTTPWDYYSNSRANLGRPRISAKSIAEQLGISRERVGSIIHEDLDMRKPSANWVPKWLNADQKMSTVPVVWANFGIFSARSKLFLVGPDCWPWTKPGYITMSRRQSSNQWSGGIAAHPAPKNSEYKKPMENFSPRFFGIKTASSSLIIFQRAELLTRRFTHIWWLVHLKDILKEKLRGKVTNGVLFLHDNAPSHRALATQKKLAYLGFQFLDHPPYSPDLAPADYHLFPGLKKKLKDRHFFSDAEVIAAA